MKNLRNKGFTLIELIVVIAILGVLAAVLIPSISNYVNRANLSVASKNGSAVLSAANRITTKIGTGELSSLDTATIYAECGIEVTLGASAPTTDGVVMEVVDNQVQTIWSRKGDQLATWTKADGWDFTVSSGGGSGGSGGGTPQTITFSTNGGSEVIEITASSGEEISSPTPPTRNGYLFGGWYSDEALTTEFTFNTMPSSNMTIFAKWNINQSSIIFNSNGGSAVATITQNAFSAVTAPAAPTKTGFEFEGWYSDVGLTSAYTFSVMPVSSITLYAKWEVFSPPLYTRDGNYVWIGEWPQTIASAEAVLQMGTTLVNGYYTSAYDGARYARRQAISNGTFTTGDAMVSGETYYFKVEPIKWKIVSGGSGWSVLICESAIDYRNFGNNNIYSTSTLRSFLNVTFYNSAFNAEQKLIMSGLPNALSVSQMTSSSYGFMTLTSDWDTARIRESSDYARGLGAPSGATNWWLSDPQSSNNNRVHFVYREGAIGPAALVTSRQGVVPHIYVNLS